MAKLLWIPLFVVYNNMCISGSRSQRLLNVFFVVELENKLKKLLQYIQNIIHQF